MLKRNASSALFGSISELRGKVHGLLIVFPFLVELSCLCMILFELLYRR